MEAGCWLKVWYNSARSDEKQTATGKVRGVAAPLNGTLKVMFEREDGQMMEVDENDKLISYNSAYPTTGYCFKYEVKPSE